VDRLRTTRELVAAENDFARLVMTTPIERNDYPLIKAALERVELARREHKKAFWSSSS
jgi:hypothetical protein